MCNRNIVNVIKDQCAVSVCLNVSVHNNRDSAGKQITAVYEYLCNLGRIDLYKPSAQVYNCATAHADAVITGNF